MEEEQYGAAAFADCGLTAAESAKRLARMAQYMPEVHAPSRLQAFKAWLA